MAKFVILRKLQECDDCHGRFEPWLLEFDHREGSTKKGAISDLVVDGARENTIIAEMTKCDLVCILCHRRRTFSRSVSSGGCYRYSEKLREQIELWLQSSNTTANP
jgi:hypothetical protein